MKWIDAKKNPPKTDMNCLVSNSKGWMREIRAIYHKDYNVFVLYDPNYRESLLLEVTHYIPIPHLSLDGIA